MSPSVTSNNEVDLSDFKNFKNSESRVTNKYGNCKECSPIQPPQVKPISNFPLGNITLKSLPSMIIQNNCH
jgi:hypothetical protein